MKANNILKVCQTCKAMCCKKTGGPNLNKKEALRILNANCPNYLVKHSEDHYEIKSKNGTCLYLSPDNSCSIHKLRPTICRCWPIDYEYKNGKIEYYLTNCPLTKLLSKKFIQTLTDQAKLISKADIVNYYSCTALSDSEVKIIKKGQKSFKRKLL
jgi:Fe-S-cluster containining protein